MPYLARHLQEDFKVRCPEGRTCRTEVKVVPAELEQWLGYAPQADAMFQEVATGRRVWVELEISRIWQHSLQKSPDACLNRIRRALANT